ncbi:hypothetical protein PROFUN_14974 [Planoprotostelium fungivorum]|uniref:Integrase catalytic domain-containing protein n=1 Tax=Planoprotostelium fungivorum TaxID=1890364 RepID=A0A2P6MY83_9EUKA|nr:hypothetical protein PROFUN_14974 [Planoprotostelium fungivorum]
MHRGKRQRIAPSLTEYLLSIWLDPSTTSNSIVGLYRSASRHNVFKLEFTVDDISSFLSHQSTYKRHLGFNLQCKQQKHTVVPGPLVKWQMGLADMQNSANNTNYLLTIIDVFSKYALVIPLQKQIAQYLSVYRTQRYNDALELITENYNHSHHYTIRELPANVHFADRSLHKLLIPQLHVYYKYLNDKNSPIIPETLMRHYARGDRVRISQYCKNISIHLLHLSSRGNFLKP